ncbi:MAG: phosphatidate cytidylyltransferase [Bryobacteraceae bacterium]
MKRLITALLLAPAIVFVVLWGPAWLFYGVVAAVCFLCYREYAGIADAYGFGSPGPLGYGAGLLVLFVPGEWWFAAVLAILLAAVTLAMRRAELRTSLPSAALLVCGVLYVFGCFRAALPIRDANPHWLMWGLMLNWIGDTGAYYVGRRWGRHRMASRVSPKKSWEGAAASMVVSMAAGALYAAYLIPRISWPHAAALAALVNAAGQIGDLAESAMKRGAGVKDSGNILPGHGGFLDRVDGSLFALPVLYGYLRFLG